MRPRVNIETTIPSDLSARPSRDVMRRQWESGQEIIPVPPPAAPPAADRGAA